MIQAERDLWGQTRVNKRKFAALIFLITVMALVPDTSESWGRSKTPHRLSDVVITRTACP